MEPSQGGLVPCARASRQAWLPHVENGMTRATLPGSLGGLRGLTWIHYVPLLQGVGLSSTCFPPISGWRVPTSSSVASRGRGKHAQAFLGARQLLQKVPFSCSHFRETLGCLLWQGGRHLTLSRRRQPASALCYTRRGPPRPGPDLSSVVVYGDKPPSPTCPISAAQVPRAP